MKIRRFALFLALSAVPGLGQTTGAPLNLNLPTQGSNGWGTKLNQNFTALNTFAAGVTTFPATNGIVFNTSLTASRVAIYSDVVGLWTSCTAGYLQFNGTCSTPAAITSITWSLPSILTASPTTLSASGTQTFSLATQSANLVWAGPASGVAVAPTFRALVAADLPLFSSTLAGAVPASGGGTVNFLRSDGVWAVPAGSGGIANVQVVLPTTAITANTCTTVTTVTMTGVTTTSTFPTAFATDPSGVTGWGAVGGLTFVAWPTADTLNWKVCNVTAASITPGAMTLNVGAK